MRHSIISDNQELTAYGILFTMNKLFPGNDYCFALNKSSLIASIIKNPESIVFLDYNLFDFTSPNEILILSERFPDINWIIISEELQIDIIRLLYYSSEKVSLLFKECAIEELEIAIRNAEKGQKYISYNISELLLKSSGNELKPKNHTILSTTEQDVIRYMALGKSTKEIANLKYVSFHTVNTHRKNIFKKLQVNNVQEAVRKAISLGVIDMTEYYI